MHIRILLVSSYILFCLRIRANPTRYFQLNSQYFNESKGIFSKLDIDRLIPERWRLYQCPDNGVSNDFSYPVFVKPEWGQNAYGIRRANSASELEHIRRSEARSKMPRIIQEAATEAREFEIFFVLSAEDETKPAVLTICEAENTEGSHFPINSINNRNTVYREITHSLGAAQLDAIWQHMRALGRFGISRVGLRSNSIEELVKGDFHIIEINLFVPMPLNLLDPQKSFRERLRALFNTTWHLAHIVKEIPRDRPVRSVFFKKWKLSRKIKTLAVAR